MLSNPAPFPHVGSFALFVDENKPMISRRAELVRIMRTDGDHSAIAFPNRYGSTGNKLVPNDELLDATPLTKAEERALTDGQRDLRGRETLSPRLRKVKARTDTLRSRQLASIILESELAVMNARHAREARRHGATPGRMMLDERGRNITGAAA